MGPIRDRLRSWVQQRLGLFHVRGFAVVVDNTRPDIATADVLQRLDEALALVERHQPWRAAHLRRDLKSIQVMRYPCRGAFFPDTRACMVELTFLNRRDIGAETVASTIVHEGIHARVHAMCDPGVPRDRAREERICRRAELEFGQSLPPAIGAAVVERAMASLALDDTEVAPEIDWQEAQRRMDQVDGRSQT
jgi:hypothetical protein